MRHTRGMAGLMAVLLIVPAIGASAQTRPAARPPSTAAAATHTTRGVVKSVDAAHLVISNPRRGKETAFALNASTERQGHLASGAHVTVRYRTEKGRNVATVVVVESSATGSPPPVHTSSSKP
jgi:hypothetical protein